jgi:hypothetical protein
MAPASKVFPVGHKQLDMIQAMLRSVGVCDEEPLPQAPVTYKRSRSEATTSQAANPKQPPGPPYVWKGDDDFVELCDMKVKQSPGPFSITRHVYGTLEYCL